VMLAEKERSLGGRIVKECKLPGLASWARVRDYRLGQIAKLANIEVFRESEIAAGDVAAMECRHVILATGAEWLRNGTGHTLRRPVLDENVPSVWTPAHVLAGKLPEGHVVIYDDDQYYMANVIAEVLIQAGRKVTFVTPGIEVGSWTVMTDEQARIQGRLMAAGVTIQLARKLAGWDGFTARFASIYDGSSLPVPGDALMLVGARRPKDTLERELRTLQESGGLSGVETIRAIGDCYVPGAIYSAVYSGHRAAQEFGEATDRDGVGYIRERVRVEAS